MMKVLDEYCNVNKRKCWVEGVGREDVFRKKLRGPSALKRSREPKTRALVTPYLPYRRAVLVDHFPLPKRV